MARAKEIARREGVPYQHWLRERVAHATRQMGDELRPYKFRLDGCAAAIILAADRPRAESIAREYAAQMQARGESPIATRWIERAEVREVPFAEGVAVWAETGGTMARAAR